MALTDSSIRKARPRDSNYELADKGGAHGLVLRITPRGRKTFVYRYRTPDGRMKRLQLGVYPDMSLADARGEIDRQKKLRKEIDPREARRDQDRREKLRKQQEALRRRTFKQVAEHLIEHKGDGRHGRGWLKTEGKRRLEKDLNPILGDWPVDEIRRRDVIEAVEQLKKRGRLRGSGEPGRMLNVALMLIRRVLQHAVNELGVIDANPALGIDKRVPEISRDRALTLAESKTLFANLPKTGMSPATQWAIKFALFTAARIGEVAALPWTEIDRDAALWRLPGSRSKNGKPGDIPLSEQALAILDEIQEFYGKGQEYVFPGARLDPEKDRGHMHRDAAATALARAFADPDKPLGIEKFVPHDLRRSAATLMGDLGVMQEVIDACLRNSRGGVSAVYNRSATLPHTREAMARLGQHIDDAVSGKASAQVLRVGR